MRVALLLKDVTTQPMKLAGAFVIHGLSSKQALDAIRLLADKDIIIDLDGTMPVLKARFAEHGIVIEPAPSKTEQAAE